MFDPSPHIRVGEKIRKIREPKDLAQDLDSSIFVDCDFKDCGLSGAHLPYSVFAKCHFENTDLYWCIVLHATFIDCKFVNCDLRGSFTETRFIRCGFVGCQVGDNNLGGKTEWENSLAIECVVAGDPLPIVEVQEEY